MIFIRTDANETIASGHMMRCLTVAAQLKVLRHEITFLLSDDSSVKLIADMEFDHVVLNTSWNDLNTENEIATTTKILRDNMNKTGKKPLVMVDSYYVSNDYFREIRRYAYTAMFDDMCNETYDVDVLVNYNAYYQMYNYPEKYYGRSCRLLLGPMYVPLRSQFVREIYAKQEGLNKTNNGKDNVLVICGGGDSLGVLTGFMEFIGSYKGSDDYDYTVIAGRYNPRTKELREISQKHANVTLYENVKDMASVMKRCSRVISAAGTVLYECCAMELPTIFFCLADNQENDITAFASDGMMLYAGDMRKNKESTYKCIFSHLKYLDDHPQEVTYMRNKMTQVTDGSGAIKIAKELDNLIRCNGV